MEPGPNNPSILRLGGAFSDVYMAKASMPNGGRGARNLVSQTVKRLITVLGVLGVAPVVLVTLSESAESPAG